MATHTPPHFHLPTHMDMQLELVTQESDQLAPENSTSVDTPPTTGGRKRWSPSELSEYTLIACVTYLLHNNI